MNYSNFQNSKQQRLYIDTDKKYIKNPRFCVTIDEKKDTFEVMAYILSKEYIELVKLDNNKGFKEIIHFLSKNFEMQTYEIEIYKSILKIYHEYLLVATDV